MLNFEQDKITLVLCPVDMRCGFEKLAVISQNFLHINIYKGEDWVVFISKNNKRLKIIHCDAKGTLLLSRTLNEGHFQQLLTKVLGAPTRVLSRDELLRYINGEELEVKRSSFIRG